jgi:hypothetical protein
MVTAKSLYNLVKDNKVTIDEIENFAEKEPKVIVKA